MEILLFLGVPNLGTLGYLAPMEYSTGDSQDPGTSNYLRMTVA